MHTTRIYFENTNDVNPFRAPEPLSMLNSSNFVPENGFPVVKALRRYSVKESCHAEKKYNTYCYRSEQPWCHNTTQHLSWRLAKYLVDVEQLISIALTRWYPAIAALAPSRTVRGVCRDPSSPGDTTIRHGHIYIENQALRGTWFALDKFPLSAKW